MEDAKVVVELRKEHGFYRGIARKPPALAGG